MLAVTTVRALMVVVVHLVGGIDRGDHGRRKHDMDGMLDPVDWAFIIAVLLMCGRAWQLARRATEILPRRRRSFQCHAALVGGLLATTGVFALLVFGWAATDRYEKERLLLREGVDPIA